jgi:hypothetical protein
VQHERRMPGLEERLHHRYPNLYKAEQSAVTHPVRIRFLQRQYEGRGRNMQRQRRMQPWRSDHLPHGMQTQRLRASSR